MPQTQLHCHRGAPIAGLPCLLLAGLLFLGCGGPAPLSVELPLHLEDHLAAATITGSVPPANPPQPVEWRFDQPQPDWKATPLWNPPFGTPTLTRTLRGCGSPLPTGPGFLMGSSGG